MQGRQPSAEAGYCHNNCLCCRRFSPATGKPQTGDARLQFNKLNAEGFEILLRGLRQAVQDAVVIVNKCLGDVSGDVTSQCSEFGKCLPPLLLISHGQMVL